jgi:hypothetical protein
MHDDPVDPHGDPVTVLVSRDPGLLAVAKSLLEAADIQYFAKGENLQNVPPYIHWVELLVPASDGAAAKALLADLNTGP